MSGAPEEVAPGADGSPGAAGADGSRADAPPPTPPVRVRVTAPRAGAQPGASGGGGASVAGGGWGARGRAATTSDIEGEYVRSLIRSQLRAGLVFALGFVGATAVFVVAVTLLPGLEEAFLFGVPVSWLLVAAGVYPLAITVGALYVRSATRNEARYRSLAEDA
ncbi:hypothetical protein ACGGZK_05590 [Agromyces sp. MMS24-K17]|uniref:hypothetical protein n=1 Tax=Agromyces sp. MMS24-K17 TaxID=3372850 RepID=UPI003754F31D